MNKKLYMEMVFLAVTSWLLLVAPAQAAKNDHPHFKLIPNNELKQLSVSSEKQALLSDPENKPSLDELHYEEKIPVSAVTLVDTASFNLGLLTPSHVKSLDPTQPTLVLPDPQITLQGKSFTLSVLESVLDDKQKVRYVTAKIINHEGYARFIIDDSTGELVGHLDIDGSGYRILPRELSKHQQLIYKFDSDRLGKAEESRSIMVSSSENASVYRLERELLKTEAIHSIAPVYYNETLRAQGRGVDLLGGNIGRIDVDKVLKRDVSEISKLLIQLKAITDAKDSFSYVMDKIAGNTERGYSLRFRQVINGIPVRNTSRIKFDPQGNIKSLSSLIIDPALTDIKPSNYTQDEILSMAIKAAQDYLSKPDLTFVTLEQTPIRLQYKIIDNNYTLTPYWHVVLYEVQSGEGVYNVLIDGNTGKAKVANAARHITTQFQTDVCEHESGISLPVCQDVVITYPVYIFSTIREIISESETGQFICELVGLCQDPQAKHPWEVINNMEDWLSESTDGFCCDEVGGISDAVDVKINTQDSGGPSFNPGTNTISFPHPSSLDPDIFNPVQSQKIDDVVVHEATHAIMESSNPDFSNAVADNEPLAEGFLFTHPLKTFYATSFPLAT